MALGAPLVAQTVKNPPAVWGTWIPSLGWEDPGDHPWRKEWLPIPVFWPGEFREQRSLAGYGPWGHKDSDTNEQLSLLLFTFRLLARVVLMVKNLLVNAGDGRDAALIPESEDPLEEGTATPPPTPVFLPEEFHGQRSLAGYSPYIWSHRVRHD